MCRDELKDDCVCSLKETQECYKKISRIFYYNLEENQAVTKKKAKCKAGLLRHGLTENEIILLVVDACRVAEAA